MSNKEHKHIYSLFAKVASGQGSEGDRQKLEDLRHDPAYKQEIEELELLWEEEYFLSDTEELVAQQEMGEKIWEASFKKIHSYTPHRYNKFNIFRYAAVFLMLAAFSYMAYLSMKPAPAPPKPQITQTIKTTLPGQKSTITLRDGTIVYLNAGSQISYTSNYNDSTRTIELSGQAYFEVFHDKTRPFIVKCRNLSVEALGTAFDLEGYPNKKITVSLVTGKVRLSTENQSQHDVILMPGEYSIVDDADRFVKKGHFDPYEVLAWKEGRLIFKNATIKEIIPRLELWYGVNIRNYGFVDPTKPFTSTFVGENLENILMNMGDVLDFDYLIKENDVQIIKKKLPMHMKKS